MNLTLTQILDFSQLDSKLALYQQYEGFLKDVVNATDSLPFEMRWAAQKILDDMEGGVWAQIRQSAVQIFEFAAEEGGLTEAAYEAFCGSKGAGTVSGLSDSDQYRVLVYQSGQPMSARWWNLPRSRRAMRCSEIITRTV